MAERRMFSKTIIDSDSFLDMPVTARLLYYDLAMRADDDGFVNSPKKIMRMVGASQDDLSILTLRKFIIPFDSGVVVVRHWRIHNYIRQDTYHETPYLDEKRQLSVDENKAYILSVNVPSTDSQRAVYVPSTQVRKDKVSIGKDRENKADKPPTLSQSKPKRNQYGQYGWVKLSQEEYNRLSNDLGENEVKRCIAYLDESAQSTGNKNRWRDWNLVLRRCHRDRWGLGKAANQPQNVKSAAAYDDEDNFV